MKIRNMKQVTERVKGLKGRKLFRRNQIIITTLAVMIAAAGYLNYAGKREAVYPRQEAWSFQRKT